MLKKQKYIFTFLVLYSFSYLTFVQAATFELSAPWNTAAVGQPFEVSVFLNSDSERINAVQGDIIFPADMLFLKQIHDGNSIVNFWVERPYRSGTGKISFSGIIPGGYSGSKGFLFSFIVIGNANFKGTISAANVKAFLNDGLATPAKTAISGFNFTISESPKSDNLVSAPDIVPPEPFAPSIDNNPSVFGGRWFLVFSAQDKSSGIGHYEIKEGNGEFHAGESPYLLKNQSLSSDISVKAFDKTGNWRTAVLPAPRPQPWYKQGIIWIIIILAFVFIAYRIFLSKTPISESGLRMPL